MARILLVAGDDATLRDLASYLREDGHEVQEARRAAEATKYLLADPFDVVIADQTSGAGNSLELLAKAREIDSTISPLLLADEINIGSESPRLQGELFELLGKPISPSQFRRAVQRAYNRTSLLRENLLLRDVVERREGGHEVYGETTFLRDVRQKLSYIAPSSAAVLITGETGTGKNLVARAIHAHSPRRSKPFVRLNPSEMTEVLEGRTNQQHLALLNAVQEGTLFLDEIGELPLAAQEGLLGALTQRQIARQGSSSSLALHARILMSTRHKLAEKIKQGSFRQDLFQQLSIVHLHLPPLRERVADIPGLYELLARQITAESNTAIRRLSPPAMKKLQCYSFPGNVRELRNLIERAYMISDGPEVRAEDFALASSKDLNADLATETAVLGSLETTEKFDLLDLLEQTEKRLIRRTLAAAGGAQAEAARRLGISRSLLSYKLNKYGIRPAE